MASLTIKDFDDGLASRLRSRADARGHSVEDEVRAILREALGNAPLNRGQLLLDTIRAEFGPLGGVELDLPPQQGSRATKVRRLVIVLDPNVMSELMRPDPSAIVASWVVRVGWGDLRVTTITRAEIMSGIAILPPGRRQALEIAAGRTFDRVFDELLPFDAQAADHYAEIVAARRKAGRSAAAPDMMIAAIAHANGAAVATRNITDFEECGIVLHDPWQGH